MKQHLGIIGLGVMGRHLALNAESKGFSVAGFDLDREKAKRVASDTVGHNVITTSSMQEFVNVLDRPRRIWMMVPAGKPVDTVLGSLKPLLERDDIVIDGGNSYFRDTERRVKELDGVGLRLFGMGVSGGEEGALHGPSLMPGGREDSYRHLEPVLTKMAAQTSDGPCCTYIGPGGSGHYVKMVHNGIEYGILQLVCETYDFCQRALGLSTSKVRDTFAEWIAGDLNSFLLEIATVVLGKKDIETGKPLVELILDVAEQKGTGEWTAEDALEIGVAVPTVTASVEARTLSSAKQERMAAAEILRGPSRNFSADKKAFLGRLRQAYHIAAIATYAQGFSQLRVASEHYQYNLRVAEIARIWKGGCIIRAKMLDPIAAALRTKPNLQNLMLDPGFSPLINENSDCLREVVKTAVDLGVPCLAFSTALGYIDSYRAKRLPANLLQALRDCFGAHTYRRIDMEGTFHTDWNE